MIRLQEYKEGDIVLKDVNSKRICILESGSLEVVREGRTLSEIDQPGSIFGELSKSWYEKRCRNSCQNINKGSSCRGEY